MKLRSKISAMVMVSGLAAAANVVAAGPAQAAVPPPPNGSVCAILTDGGFYVTAVDGGGRSTTTMRTDSRVVGPNEKFTLESVGDGVSVDLRTHSGNYVTVLGGWQHEQILDVVHTDATVLGSWEKLQLTPQSDGRFGIRVVNGFYLTAVDGGGHQTAGFDANRTSVRSWEKFRFFCGLTF